MKTNLNQLLKKELIINKGHSHYWFQLSFQHYYFHIDLDKFQIFNNIYSNRF